MAQRLQDAAALVAVVLVALGPLAASSRKVAPESLCSSQTGICLPTGLADSYDSLMQASVVTSRTQSPRLMQESSRLQRTTLTPRTKEGVTEAPAAAAQEAQQPLQPQALAAAVPGAHPKGAGGAPEAAGPQPRPLAAARKPRSRRPERKAGRKEGALEAVAPGAGTPPPPAASPASAATEQRPRASDAERAAASLKEAPLPRPDPPLAPPGGRKQQAVLQAEAAPIPPGAVAAAASVGAPPLENATGTRRSSAYGSDLSSWGSMMGRALMLVICVACILRALICRVAMPCWRPNAPSKAASGDKQQTRAALGGPSLCPELVVPEGKECKLLVPRLPRSGLGNGGKVSICDQQGLPVLRASYTCFSCGGGRGPRSKEVRRLQLTSATGETVFASCRDAEAQPGQPTRLTLHHRAEDAFGSLSADGYQAGSGYSVVTQTGSSIYFRAGLKAGVMNATDDSGRLLAVVEPSGPSQTLLRIGQHVDAGLVALTVLGIDLLEQGGMRLRVDADQQNTL